MSFDHISNAYKIASEMGGQVGRWVAQQGDGWLSQGWLSWQRACFQQQLAGFEESKHLSKKQNGRHKQRSGQHTLARPKNKQQKTPELLETCCDCRVADVKILASISKRSSVTKLQELQGPVLRLNYRGHCHCLQVLSLQLNLSESGVTRNRQVFIKVLPLPLHVRSLKDAVLPYLDSETVKNLF